MNIRDLKYIVALSEERHFCRAADSCNVSQPALSGQIKKLEELLGITLFERTNRSVHITEVGEEIVAKAKQIITFSDEIREIAQMSKDPYSGQFRLGVISTIAPYLTPLILPIIRKSLPNLSITLVEGLTDDIEKKLDEGLLDGAIIATVPNLPYLSENHLYYEPFWLAVPNHHELADLTNIAICDVPQNELLLLSEGHCLRDQVLSLCGSNSETAGTNTRQVGLETILALVEVGSGITLVPELAKPAGKSIRNTLSFIPEVTNAAGRDIRLIYRTSSPRGPLLSKLSDLISNCSSVKNIGTL